MVKGIVLYKDIEVRFQNFYNTGFRDILVCKLFEDTWFVGYGFEDP